MLKTSGLEIVGLFQSRCGPCDDVEEIAFRLPNGMMLRSTVLTLGNSSMWKQGNRGLVIKFSCEYGPGIPVAWPLPFGCFEEATEEYASKLLLMGNDGSARDNVHLQVSWLQGVFAVTQGPHAGGAEFRSGTQLPEVIPEGERQGLQKRHYPNSRSIELGHSDGNGTEHERTSYLDDRPFDENVSNYKQGTQAGIEFHSISEERLQGTASENERHELQKRHYPNTSRSELGCLEVSPTGHGEIHYLDGRMFEGTLSNGKRYGQGSMNFPDGSHFDGYYIDDKATGYAVYQDQNGDILFKGFFKDGVADGLGSSGDGSGGWGSGEYRGGHRQGYFKWIRQNGETFTKLYHPNGFDDKTTCE